MTALEFILLFTERPDIDEARSSKSIRAHDVEMRSASVERSASARDTWQVRVAGTTYQLALRRVEMVEELAAAIRTGPYAAEIKQEALGAKWMLLLRLERPGPVDLAHAATLAAIAGAVSEGASVVVNVQAGASLPAGVLVPPPDDVGRLAILRNLPLGLLYTGLTKYEIQDEPGVWVSTRASHLFGLSELTRHVPDHSHSSDVMELFDRLQRYCLDADTDFKPHDTASLGPARTVRFEAAPPALPFVDEDRPWLVIIES